MKKSDYAYAVGRLRVKELSLLSSSDTAHLISAKSYSDAVSYLNTKGYEITSEDYSAALKKQKDELWNLMKELLKDIHEFDSLIIQNDYHNLKIALKSAVSGADGEKLLVSPSVYSSADIYSAVAEKSFNLLPEELRAPAEKAYDILIQTRSAQNADAVCDRAAMEAMLRYGKKASSKIFAELASYRVAASDIKIVYRSTLAEKSKEFMTSAAAPCPLFDTEKLIESSSGGVEGICAFLEGTPFKAGADALRQNAAAFEKICDDMIMTIIEKGKQTAFGIEPIVAFYEAKQSELLTVRIILAGKLSGASEEIISERVRKLYV